MQTAQSESFEKAYREAFALAADALLKKDIRACCAHADARLLGGTEQRIRVELPLCNKRIAIDLPDCIFTTAGGEDVSMWEKLLILHYLCAADGYPLSNRLVSFRQLKTAVAYFTAFEKRCIQPFVRLYARDPRVLAEQLHILGAQPALFGDFAVRLNALPRVPVVFMVWHGDDEFPAAGNILFDESIEHYLSAEDITVMCQQIIMKTARRL